MDRDSESFMIVFVFGMVGVIIAFILEQLDTRGILIDAFITGSIIITDLMVVVIMLFLLIGVVLAVLR